MNKLSKILAVTGAVTGIAYLTKKMLNKPHLETKGATGQRQKDNYGSSSANFRDNRKSSDHDTSDYSNERTHRMYKDLGMTEDQRRRYESDYRTVMERWEKDNPNVPMNEKMKVDEHNSALNAVLNEAQYSIYREWSKKNPN